LNVVNYTYRSHKEKNEYYDLKRTRLAKASLWESMPEEASTGG